MEKITAYRIKPTEFSDLLTHVRAPAGANINLNGDYGTINDLN